MRNASLATAACRAAVAPDARAFVCGFTYLFVAGLHHSGTSLVHELVAARPAVSRLNLAKRQGEGQQAQRVWRPAGKRDADACATSLELGGEKVRLSKAAAETHCRDGLRKVGDDDAARASLAATWGPLWGGAGGLYRVEKDPDFGSAFLKLRLFPHRSAAVFVMRHPFATALSYRKHCGVATKCVAVWLEVWTACLRALRRDPAPHAVVRYEDVIHHADAVVDAVVGGRRGGASTTARRPTARRRPSTRSSAGPRSPRARPAPARRSPPASPRCATSPRPSWRPGTTSTRSSRAPPRAARRPRGRRSRALPRRPATRRGARRSGPRSRPCAGRSPATGKGRRSPGGVVGVRICPTSSRRGRPTPA